MRRAQQTGIYPGIALAVLAVLLWSGNFIVARGVYKQVPPISLAFYRWITATLILAPFAFKKFNEEKLTFSKHWRYFFWVALWGVALFNTFVYIAGHYSPAINLAMIGTTSSPVFSIILAAIFLKEKITMVRIVGLCICISGILVLLSSASLSNLLSFRFSTGDLFILTAAFCFAVYNVLVKKKPVSISTLNFLFITFLLGTLLLFPAWLWELSSAQPVAWNKNLFFIIIYLGGGASVLAYLCWNMAIARLGAARTALFGNLIPIFSSMEASSILGERITAIHMISLVLVIAGLVIANLYSKI
jgi:drug/metabolite transporter (DMT)-like permease